MKNRASSVQLLLLLLLFIFICELEAVTVYTKDQVIQAGETLTIGDVIHIPGVVDRKIEAIMQRDIPFPAGRFSLIPPGLIKSVLENYYKESIFVIGKPTIVIPEKLMEKKTGIFYSELLNFIRNRYPESRGRTAYNIVKRTGPLPQKEKSISFFLPFPEEDDKLQLFYTLDGREELGEVLITREQMAGEKFLEEMDKTKPKQLPGSPLKDTLRFTEKSGNSHPVRGGDQITIRFIKKNIRLKMEGRAYSSGRTGESISVSPASTNKRFMGKVTGPKEVTVEIP